MDEREERLARVVSFAIPTGAVYGDERWRCCSGEFGEKAAIHCGCPSCFADLGLTLIFNADDTARDMPKRMRRLVATKLELAKIVPELECPGYRDYRLGLGN